MNDWCFSKVQTVIHKDDQEVLDPKMFALFFHLSVALASGFESTWS